MVKTLAQEQDLLEIKLRLQSLAGDEAGQWGTMSVEEMLAHLESAFRVALGELPMAKVPLPVPRWLAKRGALRMPVRWPHGVKTVPELERGRARVPEDFASERRKVLEELDRFMAAKENRTEHAMFGEMEPSDWMRWGYLHADHHLRQFGR